jgi:hypothetical protein
MGITSCFGWSMFLQPDRQGQWPAEGLLLLRRSAERLEITDGTLWRDATVHDRGYPFRPTRIGRSPAASSAFTSGHVATHMTSRALATSDSTTSTHQSSSTPSGDRESRARDRQRPVTAQRPVTGNTT